VRIPAKSAVCSDRSRPPRWWHALVATISSVHLIGSASSFWRLAAALRRLSPLRLRRWALWTKRSRIASASVGWPMTSCQCSTGSWLVTMVEPRPCRSSIISSRSARLRSSVRPWWSSSPSSGAMPPGNLGAGRQLWHASTGASRSPDVADHPTPGALWVTPGHRDRQSHSRPDRGHIRSR
jgi:hypothetical protein